MRHDLSCIRNDVPSNVTNPKWLDVEAKLLIILRLNDSPHKNEEEKIKQWYGCRECFKSLPRVLNPSLRFPIRWGEKSSTFKSLQQLLTFFSFSCIFYYFLLSSSHSHLFIMFNLFLCTFLFLIPNTFLLLYKANVWAYLCSFASLCI